MERGEMGDIDSWFLVPSPAASSILKQYLSSHDGAITAAAGAGKKSDSNLDYYNACLLRKASLICSIKDTIADGDVTEEVLDSLIMVEEVDREQGVTVSASMMAAFCSVVVHCTLVHLTSSWPCYYNAVSRIWGLKIPTLENSQGKQLIGPDLRRWRDKVEAALWDTHTSQALLLINTRNEALKCIRVYLEEAHDLMKPAFGLLALIAKVDSPASKPDAHTADKEKGNLREDSDAGLKGGASQPVIHPESENLREDSDAGLKGGASQPVIHPESEKKQPTSLSSDEVNKVQQALKSSMAALRSVVTDPLPEALQVDERVASRMAGKVRLTEALVEELDKDKGELNKDKGEVPSEKGNLREDSDAGLKGGASQPVIHPESEKKQPTSLSSNEVNKVQQALKSSMAELRAVVTDPLPEALQVAERVASRMAGKVRLTEALVEEVDKDKGELNKDKGEVPSASGNPTNGVVAESAKSTQKLVQDERVEDRSQLPRSLMERNCTARTQEWEDPIEVSSEGTSKRCRLPSPRIQPVSPINVHQPVKWKRRRKRNAWSLEEEEALMKGVEKYGRQWTLILKLNPGGFINRTPIDLKDKWRNLTGG